MRENVYFEKDTLIIGDKRISNCIGGRIKKRSNVTVLYNDNEFQIFDNNTGEMLFYWKGKYLFRGSYIKLLDETLNKKAAISYKGEYLISFEIGATEFYVVQKSRTAFFVELKDSEGCYFSNTKQFIECKGIKKDKSRFSGSYELYINQKWQRYVLRNGKYVLARYEKICYYS